MSEAKAEYGLVLQPLLRIREEIDDLIETLEVLSDKELLKGIKESLEEAKRGEGTPVEDLLERVKKASLQER
ncbi:MAG: hypothetical protein AOA65_1128 [Candidatus Bathyarchaeota archaeon BA1]|nr:MAG: hypothetical protein AOA65_1128 [Candidatus Bathyarchaeota archaeon BA1]